MGEVRKKKDKKEIILSLSRERTLYVWMFEKNGNLKFHYWSTIGRWECRRRVFRVYKKYIGNERSKRWEWVEQMKENRDIVLVL
jgi:hypothetical protein